MNMKWRWKRWSLACGNQLLQLGRCTFRGLWSGHILSEALENIETFRESHNLCSICPTCSSLLDALWDVHRMRWHDFRRFKHDKNISISQQRNPSSELRNLRSIVDTAFVRFCSCAVAHSAFGTCDFWTWEFRKSLATWSKCSVVAICKYQSFPCLRMSIVAQYILHLKKPSQQSEDTESSRAKAALQLSSVIATDVGFEWFWGNETYLSKLWLWINICCDRLEIEWLVCLRLHTLMVMCQAKQLLNQLGMRWERVRPGPGSWGRWFVKVKRRRFN